MTTIGVVQFPGTNCELDVVDVVRSLGAEPRLIWHGDADPVEVDGVIVPGGFAHGDYLRPGAIARFSPVMASIVRLAESGRPVLGICNGFQVLTEAGLLPGALQKNAGLKFLCEPAELVVAATDNCIGRHIAVGDHLSVPINHFEGSYVCDEATAAELEARGQIALTYADNPNGSVANIAGVSNARGNVVALMPHPERASSPLLGSVDGLPLLQGLIDYAAS